MSENVTKANNDDNIQLNKSSLKKDVPLSKWEFGIYIIIWFYFIFRGMYDCYVTYKKYMEKVNITVKRDVFGVNPIYFSDYNIDVLRLFYHGTPYFVIYICISRLLRKYKTPQIYMLLCTCISLYLFYYFSNIQIVWYIAQMYVACGLCGLTRSKLLVWCMGLYLLYQVDYLPKEKYYNSSYLFSQIFPYCAVVSTKAISVGIAICRAEKRDWKLFLETTFYFWYFPSLFGTLFMVYDDFINQVYKPYEITNWLEWFLGFVKSAIYLAIWVLIAQYCPVYNLYEIAPNPAELSIYIFIGGQVLHGLNEFMFLFVTRSFGGRFTKFDGFETAPPPLCIAHIALYSQMWRNFEIGMHYWVKAEIFRPINRLNKHYLYRYLAVLASFSFVIVFHGIGTTHGTYIIFNICQYFVQLLIDHLYLNTKVGHYLEANYSSITLRRLAGLFGAISFYTSGFSYFTHCHGLKISLAAFQNTYKFENILPKLMVVKFFAYCHGNISKQVHDWMIRNKIKKSI